MQLSIATLFITYTLICASIALYFLVTWLGQRERVIHLWMGLSATSGMAGLLTFMARKPDSGSLVVWAAWALFIQAMAFWWTAVRHVDRRSHPVWAVAAGTLVWTVAFLLLPKTASEAARNEIATTLIAGYSLAMLFEMLRGVRSDRHRGGLGAVGSRLMAAIAMCAHSCICLSAIVSATVRTELFLPAIDRDTWAAISFLEGMIVYIIMALTLSTLELDNEAVQQRRLATTDFMTGILTRRGFFDTAAAMLARAPRHVALIVFDLDHFKAINDGFGHAAGDVAILVFTEEVKTHLANFDDMARFDRDLRTPTANAWPGWVRGGGGARPQLGLFARLGGEEFACLLPETSAEQAMRLAEDIRASLAARTITVAGGDLRMTVSAGVVARAHGDQDIDAMLGAADKALYAAKHNGRNRVESGEPLLQPALATAC